MFGALSVEARVVLRTPITAETPLKLLTSSTACYWFHLILKALEIVPVSVNTL